MIELVSIVLLMKIWALVKRRWESRALNQTQNQYQFAFIEVGTTVLVTRGIKCMENKPSFRRHIQRYSQH